MLENLAHSYIYKNHCNEFMRARSAIEEIYAGYKNKDKIINLLNSWLFTIRALIATSGSDAATKFINIHSSSKSIFMFAEYHDTDFNIGSTERNDDSFTSLLAYTYTCWSRKIYLPAGKFNRTIAGRLINRISLYFAKNLKSKQSAIRRHNLIAILSDLYCNDSLVLAVIQNKLPLVFYSEQINTWRMSDLICDGSSHCFLDFRGYENLFLLDRRIVVIGRQHGGGYGMYQFDFYLELELSLCDEFIGWNLFDKNDRQHRYSAPNNAVLTAGKRRIVWVERSRIFEIYAALYECNYIEHNLRSPIEYVARELKPFASMVGNLVYPNRNHPNRVTNIYSGLRFAEISRDADTGEKLIGKKNIVIFDMILNSLIYYCIDHGIRFIIVTNRNLSRHYTPAMRIWAIELRKQGCFVFDDEDGMLGKLLSDLVTADLAQPVSQ